MRGLIAPPAVEAVWPDLHQAIHRAGVQDDLSALKRLLDAGADVTELAHVHTARDMNVLHTAAGGSVAVVELLLKHGAAGVLEQKCGPGEEGRWAGHTPLQMAARSGRPDIAECLLKAGAEYDVFSAVALGDVQRVAETLACKPEILETTNEYESSLLHCAVAADQRAMTAMLLERGADIEARDLFAETPLLVAAARQAAQQAVMQVSRHHGVKVQFDSLVELLLQHGATMDVFAAAAVGDANVLSGLLEADRSSATRAGAYGSTPLHWAARTGQREAAKLLLEAGADVNAVDAISCPPIWYAAYWGQNAEMTYFLGQHGADVSLRNIWGNDLGAYDCGWGCAAVLARFRD